MNSELVLIVQYNSLQMIILMGASAQDTISTLCMSTSGSKRFCSSSNCENNEIIFCLGENQGFTVNCTAPFQYCVENNPGEAICSESSNGCGSDFFCTGEGIFPDPLDCKKYHYCVAQDNKFVSSLYECPDRYVFDPDSPNTNYCRLTNNFYCTVPNCRNSNEIKNVLFLYPFFPYNRQFVALCIPNEIPKVYKCPNSYVADLSTIPVTCIFKCRTPGLFPYPGNETLFYECYYNTQNQMVQRIGNCFENWIFVEKICQLQATTTQSTSLATSSNLESTSLSSTSSLSSIASTTAVSSVINSSTQKFPSSTLKSSTTLDVTSTSTQSMISSTLDTNFETTTEPSDETSQSTDPISTTQFLIPSTTCIKLPC